VTFSEIRNLFTAVYTWSIRPVAPADRELRPKLFSQTRDPERAWQLVRLFSSSRRELIDLSARHARYGVRDEDDFRFGVSILRDRPFVVVGDNAVVAPICRYLGLAFGDGVFDWLQRHFEEGNPEAKRLFDEIMGDVAERYVEERVTRALGKGWFKRLAGRKGELSPDALVGEDLAVEIKAQRLLRGILTTGRIAARHYIGGKHGLAKGVAQLLAEFQRTREGRGRGLGETSIDEATPCLVTPDGFPGFHLAPVRAWVLTEFRRTIETYLREVLPEAQRGTLSRLEWLSFDELDRLCITPRIG
jgi:hypothetical protein